MNWYTFIRACVVLVLQPPYPGQHRIAFDVDSDKLSNPFEVDDKVPRNKQVVVTGRYGRWVEYEDFQGTSRSRRLLDFCNVYPYVHPLKFSQHHAKYRR